MSLLTSRTPFAAGASYGHQHHHCNPLSISSLLPGCRPASHVALARKGGVSSRTRRLEERGKKDGGVTAPAPPDVDEAGAVEEEEEPLLFELSTTPMPELPGDEPDFWEGPQWEPLGFFIKYMWAFGIVFALIASGVAVATYNEGATDFRQTPAFKESVQPPEFPEDSESSSSDVFEGNPTEVAPALE